jgi:uncharacterized protein YcbX
MTVVGRVESLWRYPVKSMRGEELREAFLGFAGVYGDRIWAFRSPAAPKGFPYHTGREQEQMLLYRPAFRHAEHMARPPNLPEAEAMPPGATPVYPDPDYAALDVTTPSGEVLAIDNPRLLGMLGDGGAPRGGGLTLHRSDRAMTDCRPVSLFSVQTARRLGEEVGREVDKRRFRANLYLDLGEAGGFAEDGLVGRRLRVGEKAVVAVTDRDPRCKMVTLDPDTAERNPEVLRAINNAHANKAGIYGAVLVEGTVRPGDEIVLAD